MSVEDDKTIGIGEEIRTLILNQPYSKLKRPDTKQTTRLNMSVIRFSLPGNVQIDIPAKEILIIGRQKGHHYTVDLDLEAFGGAAAGVSRLHAEIHIVDGSVYIRDTNSRNGVYHNKEELYSGQNYKLRDGDEVFIGKVKMQVFFLN